MKNILKIIQIAKPLYHLVAILAILILTTSLLNLIAPILSKSIIDQITDQLQRKGGNLNTLFGLIGMAFAANILSLILSSVSDRMGDHFAGRLRKFLTEKFYDKVLTLPQSYFDSEISGKIISQLNRGILTIQGFINGSTNFMLPTFLQSFLIVLVLARYSMPIALFIAALFPIYMFISYWSTIKWGQAEVKKNAIEDQIRGRLQEVILNMPLVKSFTKEVDEYNFISKNLRASNVIYAGQSTTFHWYDFFRGLSLQIILFAVNIISFYNAFTGKYSIGELVLILQLVNQARIPLFAMSYILTQIQQAEAGSKEYFEILNLKSTEDYRKIRHNTEKLKKLTLEFKNIFFSYDESGTVLQDVSFKLNSHESVALVGHSGAGKSTIISLLLKFYDPTQGEIYMSGKSYKDYDAGSIRNNIALVFQDNELFSSTVRENVAYGNPKAEEKDIIQALKDANAYEFVMKLPKNLNSEIGERGVRLSGGQKQRIQIARAIIKDAPILILDEATSSLDAKSEKEVQIALERLMKDRLVIIIAHRFSTIQNVDKVVVIDEGNIVGYDSPQNLAKKKGIYSELLRYQIEGNKKLLEKYELF